MALSWLFRAYTRESHRLGLDKGARHKGFTKGVHYAWAHTHARVVKVVARVRVLADALNKPAKTGSATLEDEP